MNTSQLSSYAPEARNAFIAAVSAQAARLGITSKGTADAQVQGDVLLVGGQAFPKAIASARKALAERVEAHGFDATMEAIAYSWFNRFVAMRYMEMHGYFDHGYRVLSHPENQGRPEILDHAADVELPNLDRGRAVELKLDGTKDAELYRMLLIAQCNTLHHAMPFLFEKIGDDTELLLPANLLHTDSLIRQLVDQIDENLWQEIEIIGWLYQFYISEKKDQVIGKVVVSEDIPAATQLFTPKWIVKYMVQNSLGAQWLATYPNSPLKGQMDYYIAPAEQTEEVKAQLAAITPSTLNPEELTLIDPASGSGHILVEAYGLFKAIYLERGYQKRDVAQLILEKNLFDLDIDERAAQLTGFALMMKGRADYRRLFERGVKLNVTALVDSAGFDTERLTQGVKLADYGLQPGDLTELKRLFEHATTFGSLIQVPDGLAAKLPALKQLSDATSHDLFVSDALKRLGPLVQQAELLANHYDAVVANPPYMGSNGMNALVKQFAKVHFPDAKSDLFACFIERSYTLAKDSACNSIVTMQSWMFLSSFQKMRERMLREKTIQAMVQIGFNSFPSLNSKIALATVFSIANRRINEFAGTYVNLNDAPHSSDKEAVFLAKSPSDRFVLASNEFKKIPGSPVAYSVAKPMLAVFERGIGLGEIVDARQGLDTGDNDRFLRNWYEVERRNIGFSKPDRETARASGRKWFPCNKGGPFRKWWGNQEFVINWEDDGRDLFAFNRSNIRNPSYYFRPSLSWSDIAIANSFRIYGAGFIHETTGMCAFGFDSVPRDLIAAYVNTAIVGRIAPTLNPTLHFKVGNFGKIPFLQDISQSICDQAASHARWLVSSARMDWDAYERSWEFQRLPILTASFDPTPTLESSYTAWITQNRETIAEMKCLEEENNRLFIDAYGLADELTPDVPIEQITLTVNPAYRYGGKLNEEEQWIRFRQDTMEELVSYAIGCMLGSLQPGRAGTHLREHWRRGLRPQPLHHVSSRRRRHCPAHRHRVVRRRCRPIASASSSRWPGMRSTSKTTSPSWPTTFRPRRTSLAARPSAATSATASSRTNVSKFEVGDQVFGSTQLRMGAYGEYVCLPAEYTISAKPSNMSFEEAAAVPLGGLNALHFLRMACVQKGEKVPDQRCGRKHRHLRGSDRQRHGGRGDGR